jgi:DnaD/phage-associated family protein
MPGGMPWVKIYTEILDDPKVAKVSDKARWRFIQLILVAAECDAGGAFVVGDEIMTIEEIAWRLRMDKDSLEADIKVLLSAGIMAMDGKILEIPKFAERQGPTQKEKRDVWKARQQKRRERVTRDTCVSHSLEKRREEKNREEEEKLEPPPQNPNFLLYSQEIGEVTPFIADDIENAEKMYPIEWIPRAIKRAAQANVRKMSYVTGILKQWKIKGFPDDDNQTTQQGIKRIIKEDENGNQYYEEVKQ